MERYVLEIGMTDIEQSVFPPEEGYDGTNPGTLFEVLCKKPILMFRASQFETIDMIPSIRRRYHVIRSNTRDSTTCTSLS
ncbi:hypothetical protein Har1129_18365 [Haloarcula sp. CBA1129]|nr:hypothetical protein Har1129_18365 [Haloarcula sp. CBA1129]